MAISGVGAQSPGYNTTAWQPPRSETPEPPIPEAKAGYGYVPAPYYGYVQSTLEVPLRKYEDLPTPKYGDEQGPKRPEMPLPQPRPTEPVTPPPQPPVTPPAPVVPLSPIGPIAGGGDGINLAGLLAPVRNVPQIFARAATNAAAKAGGQGVALQASMNGLKGLRPTMGSVLWQTLNPAALLKSTGFAALIAAPIALIENLIDHNRNKTSTQQLLAGTLADTVGYTAAGVGGTVVGGLIGSIVPGLGTIVGMAAGALFSTLYDRLFRKRAHAAMLAQVSG
ncbi:MAG: hypothetical protein FJZ01_16980 [Candidatus Sericytochromatia bacterium]|nr:hypothetical protein [Candidatus Tanganyikabacteria bacterium]